MPGGQTGVDVISFSVMLGTTLELLLVTRFGNNSHLSFFQVSSTEEYMLMMSEM